MAIGLGVFVAVAVLIMAERSPPERRSYSAQQLSWPLLTRIEDRTAHDPGVPDVAPD